jgi:hypothetical protein
MVGGKPVSAEVTKKTKESVAKIVREAFETCDIDKSGHLDFEEFKNWIISSPDIMAKMEEVLVRYSWESLINDFQERRGRGVSTASSGRGGLASTNEVIVTILCPNCKWQPQFCYSCGEKFNVAGLLCSRFLVVPDPF